jgi:hypothetical protein
MKEKLIAEKTNILILLTSSMSSPQVKVAMSKIVLTAEEQDRKNERILEPEGY